MIRFINITNQQQHIFFEKVLNESFPMTEHPSYAELLSRSDSCFVMQIILYDAAMVGIFSYWNFSSLIYCEHFAIDSKYRNQGIGGEILDTFMNEHSGQIVLEVEIPDSEIALRRINFYQRHGLIVNEFDYWQPSYSEQKLILPMYLMTTTKLDIVSFKNIKQLIY